MTKSLSVKNLQALKPGDVEAFAEAINHYFVQITGEKAQVRTAYVMEEESPDIHSDFNGQILVFGNYLGSIRFAAPQTLLSHVLLRLGESKFSDADHLDVVGEIANNLAGRVRRIFGHGLEISPPITYTRTGQHSPYQAESQAYVVPFRWKTYEAMLVVHLDVALPGVKH